MYLDLGKANEGKIIDFQCQVMKKFKKEQFLSSLSLPIKTSGSCLKIHFFFKNNRRQPLLFPDMVRRPGLNYILQVRVAMGAACNNCMQFFTPHKQELQKQPNDDEQMETNRKMTTIVLPRNSQRHDTLAPRGSNIEAQSNPSAMRDTKIFSRTKSTALFSSLSERRHSSICQFTLDHESILICGNDNQPSLPPSQQYYTLISKVAFVKKTLDCIKVITPDGQSELHCPPQLLFTTMTLSQGRPAQNLEEVAPNKFIQVSDSPIKANIRLKCKNCKKKMKTTSCKGIINIATIQCPTCERKQWKLVEADCNAPIWGDGKKITPKEVVDPAPSTLRIMGCVICLKFTNCSNMSCGCLLCSDCLSSNPFLSLQVQCRLCTEVSIL